MPPNTRTRRAVLRTLATIGVGTGTLVSTVGAREKSSDAECPRRTCRVPPNAADAMMNRSNTYRATVDRIVDGDHVVVLLEAGGRTVDQLVVSAASYPCLEERDRVLVRVDGDGIDRYWRLEGNGDYTTTAG